MTPFVPSPYQAAFFDALITGTRHIQLRAVAGSGKTLSLEEGVKRLPLAVHRSVFMTAFNKHIETELKERQAAGRIPQGVRIQTIHGFGYGILKDAFKPRDAKNWCDFNKYRKLTRAAWMTSEQNGVFSREEALKQKDIAETLTYDLARLCLLTCSDPSDPRAVAALMAHFCMETPDDIDVTAQALCLVPVVTRWGREGMPTPDEYGLTYHPSERVSGEDMVALPLALNLPVPQFDYLFIDECQDLNRAQQELMLRARSPQGRVVFVGDPAQAIYGFSGADAAGFGRLRDATDALTLPLSICYRCSRSVARLAASLVPELEAAPDAPEGSVTYVTDAALLDIAASHFRATPGEPMLLLCRTNAPLVSAAFELIRRRVPARVKGRDIGQSLIKTLEEIARLLGFDVSAFDSFASAYTSRKTATLSRRDNAEAQIEQMNDRVQSLLAVVEYMDAEGRAVTVAEIRAEIANLFSDDVRGITLSSIHKAKGLEARRVGILHSELLPHPMARQAWEREQENNLAYVAVTRAMEELYVAGDPGFLKGMPTPKL